MEEKKEYLQYLTINALTQEKDIFYVERLRCTCTIFNVLIHTTKTANAIMLKLYF